MKRVKLTITGLAIFLSVQSALAAEADYSYPTDRACTVSEAWKFSSTFLPEFQKEFKNFLSNGKSSVRGFSEAIALRRTAKTAEEKFFAEYWMAHALLDSGQTHTAYQGFLAIVAKPAKAEYVGVHAAALDCVLSIHYAHPAFVVPSQITASLTAYTSAEDVSEAMKSYLNTVAWDAEVSQIQTLLSDDRVSPQVIQSALNTLQGSGPYLAFAQGLWMAKQGDHFKTIENLQKFVDDPKIPYNLGRYIDLAHVFLARAHYSVGQYDVAGDELKRVRKKSNFLAETLQELSWSYLMNEKYPEAIGTAMNLEAGGLRHTFAPEAPMVMAMATNELCQYPDSVRSIKVFRKNYESSYRWLSNWVKADQGDSSNLYETSVKFIKRKPVDVPDRIASEWIRSPLFISSQDEVNLYFDEKDAAPKISKAGANEQRKMAQDILKKARELKPKLKLAKMKLKLGDSLPGSITDALVALKDEVVHWRRLQLAAPVWQVVSTRFLSTVPTQQGKLIARINNDIKLRNVRMYTQLDEIAENIQLIEVEIYNGASEDIIWQNAHPDYKEVAKQFKGEQGLSPDKVWDWGRSLASESEKEVGDETGENGPEIWEDELGSFKANLFDNCSSKDKYLSLKVKRKS
jgi:tetratricopeptide (TPR) repeat protein